MTSPASSRLLRAVAVSACLAVVALAGAQSPAVAATRTCDTNNSPPKYPNTNPGGYFTSLKVTSVGCASGRKLMVAYYKCRRANGQGISGKCKSSKVNGLRCTEKRPPVEPGTDEFNARVTCTSGSKKVVHTYQQRLG